MTVRSLVKGVLTLITCSTLVHCTSLRKSTPDEAVTLELKGQPGTSIETRYYSSARTLSYNENQLLRDRTESVDFAVITDIKSYDPQTKQLKFVARTVRKDGKVALHDLAFPELREEIDFVVDGGTAKVIRAGGYSPLGIFYVPSMPLPKEPVKVGDTWVLEHVWYSANDNIPLKLDIVGILKNIVPCEGDKRCADIEISGNVSLVNAPTTIGSGFESKVWGRVLFGVERGEVIWSEMRSAERMNLPGERVEVSSCMISETKLGKGYRTKLECEPKEQPITSIPML